MDYLHWTNNYSIENELRWKYAKIIDNKTGDIIAFNTIEYVSPNNKLISYDGVYYFKLGTAKNITVLIEDRPKELIHLSLETIKQYSISDTENCNTSDDFFILYDMDEEVVPLLVKMNNIKGISTFWSCSGHRYRPSVIAFKDTFDYMKIHYKKWIDKFYLITAIGTDPYYSLIDNYKSGDKIESMTILERIDKFNTNIIKPSLLDIRTTKLLCSYNKGPKAYNDIKTLATIL